MAESSFAAPVDWLPPVRPKRAIAGHSAVLLPATSRGQIDWAGWEVHLARTAAAGLVPAVNMDTGYVHQLDEATQDEVLTRAGAVLGSRPWVAGAFVADRPGAPLQVEAYRRRLGRIAAAGALPIIFPSFGLSALRGAELIEAYARLSEGLPRFLAFELGTMFAACGAIYDLESFADLLALPACVGLKHSSLSRELEWQRLVLRDERRPDFQLLTGNDLAIDMVMYGSDYLLGLSTMAPDLFAFRDRLWQQGDSRFYELNDLLQYLGAFAFRASVPAYRHTAAQVLKLRGWIESDEVLGDSPRRPSSDLPILAEMVARMRAWEPLAG